MQYNKFSLIFLILVFLLGCSDQKTVSTSSEDYNCNIRINRDPGRINPFYAPTSYGRELFQYIFLPVADFHPDDLALSPILIKEIPEAKEYVDASGNEFISYDITFKNNAKWSDGTPITNTDYAFTVKAIKHPASKATRWKPYFDFIKDVMLDPNDDKKLSIIMDKDYMLSKEAALTICIMPAHVFDADNKLSTVAVKTLTSDYEETDPAMTELIEGVNASMNSKTDVVQNGPYKLIDYQTDLYIVLERIEDYWGASENDNPFLAAGPKQIIFNVVPDELTAVTMAKEGKLDFLSMKQSQAFLDLKNDETFNKMWSFHVPQLMMFYYIAIIFYGNFIKYIIR